MQPRSRRLLILLTMLVLAACATEPAPPKPKLSTYDDAVFPAPPALQPQIAFWRSVYSTWGRHQVALHDNRYLDLVYGVLILPGDVGESQTAEQKDFVKGHQNNLQAMVELAHKANAKVLLLASDIPPNYGARYHAQFQQVFVDLAEKNRLPVVRFSVQEFAKRPGFLQKDALHPTALAQPIIAQRVWLELQPLLKAQSKQRNKNSKNSKRDKKSA